MEQGKYWRNESVNSKMFCEYSKASEFAALLSEKVDFQEMQLKWGLQQKSPELLPDVRKIQKVIE